MKSSWFIPRVLFENYQESNENHLNLLQHFKIVSSMDKGLPRAMRQNFTTLWEIIETP